MYAIMTRDFKAYSHSPAEPNFVKKEYDDLKKYVLMVGSPMHQRVLVACKNVVVGYRITFRINWEWWKEQIKPEIKWHYIKSIAWLFFIVHFEAEYSWKPDKIIKDHCAESQKKDAPQQNKEAVVNSI